MKELNAFRKYLTEGIIKEDSIPSGWTEENLDGRGFDEDEPEDGHILKIWSAPMEGWDEEHKDEVIIRIGEDGKHYQDAYISFGDYEEQGPFDTYEEALKSAIGEMNAFKEDWEDEDEYFEEGKVNEELITFRKYLTEGIVNEETTYQFSEYDFSPEDDKEFIGRVYHLINTLLGDDTPDTDTLESVINSMSDEYYTEARQENKRGRDFKPTTAEEFAVSVIDILLENYIENWEAYQNYDLNF